MKKDGKKRVWFLLIFCTAVFAAFLVRLYWMQFTMADHYAKKLEQASQTSYTVRIPAARGSIVDRSGTALVQDDTVYDLALCVPAPPDTEMAQTLQTLKELDLGGKDVETQLAAFCSAVSAGELPLAENLTQAQCQSLLAAGLPQSGAVRLTARGTRTAVDGTLAPQLLGGVGAMSAEQWAQKKAQGLAMDESIGQWGLEAAWEDALRGRAGSLKVTVDRSSGGRTVKRLCLDRRISLAERERLPALYLDGRLAAVWRLGVDTEFLPEGEPCRFVQIIKETEENHHEK